MCTSAAPRMAGLLLASVCMLFIAVVQGCGDAKEALALHNSYRAKHGAPPLRWDDRSAARAKAWAQSLAKKKCALVHSAWGYRAPCGENLYSLRGMSGANDKLCAAATKMWYDEVQHFKFTAKPWSSNKGQFSKIGHFTQLIWRATTAVGCSAAGGPSCTVVVCHYVTSGNLVTDDAFVANVKSAGGGSGRKLLALERSSTA